jgi:Rrf2 family protein
VLSTRFAVAVHALALLALEPEAPATSDYVAGSIRTNPVVVRRLLGRLRKAGLVRIRPGARGGARLARPAGRITLAEIYRAVEEGELLALHRHSPNPRCPVGRNISGLLGGIFGEAESALVSVLKGRTLEQVVSAVKRCEVARK